ncbi:MAG: sulfide/dihydroorotate dehydrogenase-like FAD/NAD-binding protein [Clostridiaceae bacterium]|jgi:ferredoxin--NADP+ reductase|nr:sulfide/dihydroorotate dehydrogenase-like FAD/NAD-binding protein [Clostridiaceae bacterium]
MYEILKIRAFTESIREYTFSAPLAARRAEPGQFIILRVDEYGERVPFTICGADKAAGTVRVLVQTVGATTMKLAACKEGGCVRDIAGPLGRPTDLSEYGKILLIAGGIGAAVILPQAEKLAREGRCADTIIGARSAELLVYESDIREFSQNLHTVTDDGSAGDKGFVTEKLKVLLDGGKKYDAVFAVGPLMMMKAVAAVTKEYGLKTVVSMNSLMVDGTGMCGCCRLTVGGKTKYACVDGPEFDGHEVDFDEAAVRARIYGEQEKSHVCRLKNAH